MKRFSTILLALLLTLTMISGCSATTGIDKGKISIVCTIFPEYDWVRQILGEMSENVDLTLLLDNLIDLHNYQPTMEDIVKISSCDLFVYVGGISDKWVGDALEGASNSDMISINLLETLGKAAKAEEIIEGMQGEDDDDSDAGGIELDEHVWLSLKNARTLCPALAAALSSLDPEHEDIYQNNLSAYMDKLSDLDLKYQEAANAAPVKTLLFGDRFPFRYLVDDYSLLYHAAFIGCSAETEASFDTIIFLAAKVDELRLNNIMATESSDQSIAEAVKNNTKSKDQKVLVLDAMQSVTASDVEKGATYLSIMESNLAVLREALEVSADD